MSRLATHFAPQFLDLLPTGVFAARPDGTVEYANRLLREALSMRAGMLLWQVFPARQHARLKQWLHYVLHAGATQTSSLLVSLNSSPGNELIVEARGGVVGEEQVVVGMISYQASNELQASLALLLEPLRRTVGSLERVLGAERVESSAHVGPGHQREQPRTSLTQRETQIVELCGSGASVSELAERLNISVFTVRNHLKNIYRKLDVTSRGELVEKYRGR